MSFFNETNNITTKVLEEDYGKEFKIASKGKRLANYIIDIACYYVLAAAIGVLLAIYAMSSGKEHLLDELDQLDGISNYILGAVMLLFYCIMIETILKGKTIGKYITKTRAVNKDYSPVSFPTVVSRSLSRLIPFEAFSFIGDKSTGWHDSISETIVIEDRDWDHMDYL